MKQKKAFYPVPGKRYDAYHDGKCSPHRMVSVIIDDIIHRDQLNKKALRMWFKCIREDFNNLLGGCIVYLDGPQQFWDWNCQEFVMAHIPDDQESMKDPMLFARRPSGSWYGINWNYMLDVAGSVRKSCLKDWRTCAEECNQVMKWNRKTGAFEYFDMTTGKKIGE